MQMWLQMSPAAKTTQTRNAGRQRFKPRSIALGGPT